MELVTNGPITASLLRWGRSSGWVLSVVCKATFRLAPAEAVLLPPRESPNERDVPWGPPYGRSLRATADLVPVKANVDILLTGHAYAPAGGRPVRSLVARLSVGTFSKSIEVLADRCFDPQGALVEGQPFMRMPLVYERAAGGIGTWNPAGIAVGTRDTQGNVPLPNLVAPGTPILSPDNLIIAPVGFGPIPHDWPSRVEKLGRRSLRDLPLTWQDQSVPDDLARDYFNSAPSDQQAQTLLEDEKITLENLHASQSMLVCHLPGVRPTIIHEGRGSTGSITVRCDTLHIDTDQSTCSLVWRGHLPLRSADEAGRLTVTLDLPRATKRQSTFVGLGQESPPAPTSAPPLEGTLDLAAHMRAGMVANHAAPAAPIPRDPLSQSASSWGAPAASPPAAPVARDPLSQSSSSWGSSPAGTPARPPAPSSPSWNTAQAQARKDPLAQSGSWADAPPDATLPPMPLAAMAALPLPVPPPRRSMPSSSWEGGEAAPPPPAVVTKAAGNESPWAKGALALAPLPSVSPEPMVVLNPTYEPLPLLSTNAEEDASALQLLWFNPDKVARIRRAPAWKQLLDDLQREPLDRDSGDVDGGNEPWEIEDRREVLEVLAHGNRTDARGIEDAFAEAKRAKGTLTPPVVMVEGELETQLDELEALKATTSAAAPLVTPADEGLRAAVEAADTFLGRANLSASPAVCEGLRTKVREAFGREKKVLATDYLDKQVERALLSGRHYQKRQVLGAVFIRALLWIPGEKDALLVYIPEDVSKKLPMFRQSRMRVVGEVWPRQDEYEARSLSLRALALGRMA